MTDKGKHLLEEYKDPVRAFEIEILYTKIDIQCMIARKFSKEAVIELLNKLYEDYKDLVVEGMNE